MNECSIAFAALAALMLAGWILWILQLSKSKTQKQEIKTLKLDNLIQKQGFEKLESENHRLSSLDTFFQNWKHAPEMQSELEDLQNILAEVASAKLSEDALKEIGRIGWGIVDDSGADYSSRMDAANHKAQQLIKDGKAICSLDDTAVQPEIAACLLDAFNGYVHFYMSSPSEYSKRVQKVKMAHYLLNLRARNSLHIAITKEYLQAQLEVMRIKEEVTAYKRFKRAQDAEIKKLENAYLAKDEKLNKQLLVLRNKLNKAHAVEKDRLQKQIAELERQIEENKRSISNAELTKRGTVYVISNIGSFGKDVYKIGMTRRTDPQERVDELGVASVPFPFDVHAFIPTDNAPQLETELHRLFRDNKINAAAIQGREFYRVSLSEIRAKVETLGYHNVKWEDAPEPSYSAVTSPSTLGIVNASTTEPAVEPQAFLFKDIDSLISHLNERDIKWIDKRSKGGFLWIISNTETDSLLETLNINGSRFLKGHTRHFEGESGWFIR